MALEQISGEIKKVLQAVKTEFKMFGGVLNAAQKKILNAHDDIDRLVGTNTRQILQKLRGFVELSTTELSLLLVAISD
jgi:DNA recombination protein RmuC